MSPVIMQMKTFPDGVVAACSGINNQTQTVSYVAYDDDGEGQSGLMPAKEWDLLDDYLIRIGKGRSGQILYNHARQIALNNHEVWHPWEMLTITEMRIWKNLAEALDKGDV